MTEKLIEVHHKLHQSINNRNEIVKTSETYRKSKKYTRNMLENLPIWSLFHLKPTDIIELKNKVINSSEIYSLNKNDYLFRFGDKPKGIIVIIDGTAVIRNISLTENNDDINHTILNKKDSLLIDTKSRSQRINNIDVEITFITGNISLYMYIFHLPNSHNIFIKYRYNFMLGIFK